MSDESKISQRLRTTDEKGKRIYVYPSAVRGFYKKIRTKVHIALILFFLLLPWIHWNGQQLLFLNISKSEFHFFGLFLRAHDAPLIIFLLLGFLFTIAFITSLWGRIWCGWACPQTVFTEAVFRSIERWIEGGPRESKELDNSPMTFRKFRLRFLKWGMYSLLSLIITHSFLAYFVGSKELLQIVTSPPTENWTSFIVILFTTGIVLFDFGWFREQFCIIACPYGRFQSVILDSNSTVVGYDYLRGEPRNAKLKSDESSGDCIDCNRCVYVCPTGIDIRQGLQMECITCTACIDACDEVMTKIKKPTGLIRYTTQNELAKVSRKNFRVRPAIYAILIALFFLGLIYTLQNKSYLDITILRVKGAPYEIIRTNEIVTIVNHFRLDISNQTNSPQKITFSLSNQDEIQFIMPMNPATLNEGEIKKLDFFVRSPQKVLTDGRKALTLTITYGDTTNQREIILVGPNL
ncbi:MAG: cytochrome c oxidase accessory protein CcoG [Oligoflexia bacterium]|nr:cytochrome c oxidase accessory protein CcoG [Oligoflexia bacterium]